MIYPRNKEKNQLCFDISSHQLITKSSHLLRMFFHAFHGNLECKITRKKPEQEITDLIAYNIIYHI